MNEERIFLTDYIEKFRTAYHQARAAFELYGNALESEKKNWQNDLGFKEFAVGARAMQEKELIKCLLVLT